MPVPVGMPGVVMSVTVPRVVMTVVVMPVVGVPRVVMAIVDVPHTYIVPDRRLHRIRGPTKMS